MKNKILGVLVVAVLGLGAVCAWQWQQLRAAREQLERATNARDTEREASQGLKEHVKQLEAQGNRLGRDVDQFTALVNTLRASESQQASNLARLKVPGAAADSDKDGQTGLKNMGGMLAKLMKDPAMKEMMQAQQKMMVQRMYGPLMKDLNLAPEQKDRFMQILLEGQLSAVEQAGALMGQDDAAKAAATQALKDQEKATEDNLKTLLGEEKYGQYTGYKATLAERMQLDQFQQQLADSPSALQEGQVASLLQAMKEERDKVPPVLPNKPGENSPEFAKLLTDETMEKQFQWQEDLNRRVQDRATQILSAEQMKAFADFQSQQLGLQKMGIKMAREMFGSGGKAAPTTPPAPTPPAR